MDIYHERTLMVLRANKFPPQSPDYQELIRQKRTGVKRAGCPQLLPRNVGVSLLILSYATLALNFSVAKVRSHDAPSVLSFRGNRYVAGVENPPPVLDGVFDFFEIKSNAVALYQTPQCICRDHRAHCATNGLLVSFIG